MGLTNLEIEKHLVEFEILKNQLIRIFESLNIFVPYTGATANVDLGSFNLTTSGKFQSTGGGQTGRFLTGLAGYTVLAFDGANFDIRAGAGGSASQNVLRVDSSGNFNFYDGNITTTGTIRPDGGILNTGGNLFISTQFHILNDTSSSTSVDASLRLLKRSDTTDSLDWEDDLLKATDNSTQLDWSVSGTLDFKDNNIVTSGNIYIDSDSSVLGFGLNSPTPDATIGFDGNSFNIIANAVTGTDNLNITANLMDLGATPLQTTSTGRFDGGITDDDGLVVINLQDGFLIGPTGSTGESRQIIDWGNGILGRPTDGSVSVDWLNSMLEDESQGTSLDWHNRILYASNGTDPILNYNTAGLADFGDSTIKTTGDIEINADNKALKIGLTNTDLVIYSDGTNARIDVTGIALFESSGASTRFGVNHASNTGFGFYIGGVIKYSMATFQADTGNYEYSLFNDQLGLSAFQVDGATNNIRFFANGQFDGSLQIGLTNNYVLSRNGGTGFLDFKGTQAGFTGYDFLSDDSSHLMTIKDNGDVELTKIKMTTIGGYAIKMTNKTGANSVAGHVVTPDSANNDAVVKVVQNVPNGIGVFLDSGVTDGSEAWVVVGGIADVFFVAAATRGFLARTFVTVDGDYVIGQAKSEAQPTSPFSVDKHFCEIGHCIETTGGAGLARTVLHFN